MFQVYDTDYASLHRQAYKATKQMFFGKISYLNKEKWDAIILQDLESRINRLQINEESKRQMMASIKRRITNIQPSFDLTPTYTIKKIGEDYIRKEKPKKDLLLYRSIRNEIDNVEQQQTERERIERRENIKYWKLQPLPEDIVLETELAERRQEMSEEKGQGRDSTFLVKNGKTKTILRENKVRSVQDVINVFETAKQITFESGSSMLVNIVFRYIVQKILRSIKEKEEATKYGYKIHHNEEKEDAYDFILMLCNEQYIEQDELFRTEVVDGRTGKKKFRKAPKKITYPSDWGQPYPSPNPDDEKFERPLTVATDPNKIRERFNQPDSSITCVGIWAVRLELLYTNFHLGAPIELPLHLKNKKGIKNPIQTSNNMCAFDCYSMFMGCRNDRVQKEIKRILFRILSQ